MIDAGAAIVARAQAAGASAIAVVGTAKNVGKTVTARAILGTLARTGADVGFMTVGRDGERVDAVDTAPKPRLTVASGTLIATGRDLVPRSPALEIVAVSGERSALGPVVIARAHSVAEMQLSGPATAHGAAVVSQMLRRAGARWIVIDGAIDRLAALPQLDAVVVVATGAARADGIAAIAAQTAALVARLRVPPPDPARPWFAIDGALTPDVARALIDACETRQVVVRDPTRIAMRDGSFMEIARALDVRCEHPLDVVAVTCASMGDGRSVEPRTLVRAVAAATSLPCFDVYSGEMAA